MASFFNVRDKFFKTATRDEVEEMIENGADPEEKDRYGRSAIGCFISWHNIDVARFLIQEKKILPPVVHGDDLDDYEANLLAYCASYEPDMFKLLLSSGADRLFDSPLEKDWEKCSILHVKDESIDTLLEYEYPLISLEKHISGERLEEALRRQKADKKAVEEWFKEYTPYPQKEEFLKPLPDHDEPAIVTIIRTGRENLMKAFQPLGKWIKDENRLDLREIFDVVPGTDFFKQRMMMLEEALVMENKRQRRIKAEERKTRKPPQKEEVLEKPVAARLTVAQKRQALSEVLKAISSPKLKQEIDDSVRKRWGWKPRSKRGR